MRSPIPVVILIAKEYAQSIRRCADLLYDAWTSTSLSIEHDHAQELLWDMSLFRRRFWPNEYPMQVVEWSLLWAHRSPPPPVDALREARTALDSIMENWAAVAMRIREFAQRRGEIHPSVMAEFLEHERWVVSEQRRLEFAIAESWPVDTQSREETLLSEMQEGAGLELDEAFASIANVSKKEWLRRVKEHKQKKHTPETEE